MWKCCEPGALVRHDEPAPGARRGRPTRRWSPTSTPMAALTIRLRSSSRCSQIVIRTSRSRGLRLGSPVREPGRSRSCGLAARVRARRRRGGDAGRDRRRRRLRCRGGRRTSRRPRAGTRARVRPRGRGGSGPRATRASAAEWGAPGGRCRGPAGCGEWRGSRFAGPGPQASVVERTAAATCPELAAREPADLGDVAVDALGAEHLVDAALLAHLERRAAACARRTARPCAGSVAAPSGRGRRRPR